jgi:hypothetical protein
MPRPLPVSLDQVDPVWLTRALRTRAPGVTVESAEIVDVIRGTCTKIRLRLALDEAGRRAGIPDTVFLKGGFEEHSRELDFVLMTESLGYRDLLGDSPLNTPACYFADYDAERLQGIVIMEDLVRRGAAFGDPLKPLSHDALAASLSLLARFHAQSWGCAAFGPGDRLGWVQTAPPFSRPALKPYLEPAAWDRYVAMPRGAAVAERFQDRAWAIGALERMERLSTQVPNSIIHGDTHLGNTFIEPDGTPGFYDIVPRRAPPMSEVCYHVTLALDPADRPRWERALVRHYLDELRRCGVADAPDFDEAMRQYGAFLIEGFCLVLTNDAYFMPEAPITAYAARFSQAMLDNDTAHRLAAVS